MNILKCISNMLMLIKMLFHMKYTMCIYMCHLVPLVFVAKTNYLPGYGHYLSVWEADGNVKVCLKTNGMIADPLYVDIESTEQHENTTRYTLATVNLPQVAEDSVVLIKCSDLGFRLFIFNRCNMKYRYIYFLFSSYQLVMTTI